MVHYLGLPVDMEPVLELARRHDLFVVEDCAVALGARIDDTHVGLLGDIGCFSFYPVKHITTGEGGMVVTTHEDVAERVSASSAPSGSTRACWPTAATRAPTRSSALGLNYRLGEVGAAIGVEQMRRLPEFLEVRERNFDAALGGPRGAARR